MVGAQRCELVTMLGPAGIGKSRLVHELVERMGDRATTVRGRCLPYGEGITFWPIAEIAREIAGVGEGESAGGAGRAAVAELVAGETSASDIVRAAHRRDRRHGRVHRHGADLLGGPQAAGGVAASAR